MKCSKVSYSTASRVRVIFTSWSLISCSFLWTITVFRLPWRLRSNLFDDFWRNRVLETMFTYRLYTYITFKMQSVIKRTKKLITITFKPERMDTMAVKVSEARRFLILFLTMFNWLNIRFTSALEYRTHSIVMAKDAYFKNEYDPPASR